jgi:hypothetical protein
MVLGLTIAEAARLLSTSLALLAVMPAVAIEIPSGQSSSSDRVRIAQQQSEIPAEVQGLVDGAKAAYERGDPAEALRLQLQALEWARERLAPIHPFRARGLSNLGVFLRAVGRRQEALAPTVEAVTINREGSAPPSGVTQEVL